jgi:hypothetical protein
MTANTALAKYIQAMIGAYPKSEAPREDPLGKIIALFPSIRTRIDKHTGLEVLIGFNA